MNWIPFDPTMPHGMHWWRLPAAMYGGMECRPEWLDEARLKEDYGKAYTVPVFAHWNGWRHEVPEGLEYRALSPEDISLKAGTIVIPGIQLKECPFCGSKAELFADDVCDHGARLYYYPRRPNMFSARCSSCWCKQGLRRDLKKTIEDWNSRP